MRKRHLRHALAGMGTLALAGGIAAPAGAQEGPAVYAESVCTELYQYTVEGHVTGFPASTTVFRQFHLEPSGPNYLNTFVTDADGNGIDSGTPSTVPYAGWVRYHGDDNGNGELDPGDSLILAGTLSITSPCQGAPVNPK